MSATTQQDLESVVERLSEMLETAKSLQQEHHIQLEGDIERLVAILADKIRHIDPERFEHVTEFE